MQEMERQKGKERQRETERERERQRKRQRGTETQTETDRQTYKHTCFHLPDVDRSIGASNDHEVVVRSPLDSLNGEELSGSEHDALALLQREQRQRMVTGHGTNARQDTRLLIANSKHIMGPWIQQEKNVGGFLLSRWASTKFHPIFYIDRKSTR